MEAFFRKKYRLAQSENFDEYMKAVGVGLVTRKLVSVVTPVVEIDKEGDKYVLSSVSTFKNVVTKFTPGVEMDDVTPDGRKVKALFTIDGNTLRERQVDRDGIIANIDRKFSPEEITMTLKVKDVICTRIYKVIG